MLLVSMFSHRNLEILPSSITRLRQLIALDISDNQLRSLPMTIIELDNLQILQCQNNPWESFFAYYLDSNAFFPAIEGFKQMKNFIPELCEKIRNNIKLSNHDRSFPYFGQYRQLLLYVCEHFPTKTARDISNTLESVGKIDEGDQNLFL